VSWWSKICRNTYNFVFFFDPSCDVSPGASGFILKCPSLIIRLSLQPTCRSAGGAPKRLQSYLLGVAEGLYVIGPICSSDRPRTVSHLAPPPADPSAPIASYEEPAANRCSSGAHGRLLRAPRSLREEPLQAHLSRSQEPPAGGSAII
jgi:hypothetical protein